MREVGAVKRAGDVENPPSSVNLPDLDHALDRLRFGEQLVE